MLRRPLRKLALRPHRAKLLDLHAISRTTREAIFAPLVSGFVDHPALTAGDWR